MTRTFDEAAVATHIETHHSLPLDIGAILRALNGLSQQTYENKALALGCLIDSKDRSPPRAEPFPSHLEQLKKYRALTDGFRTAYRVSRAGKLLGVEDLDVGGARAAGQGFFPEWTEPLARASRESAACAIALTRHGDILVFDSGNLRFTNRFGAWQYWNHNHLVDLITGLARVQRVAPKRVGRVCRSLYRSALDISFRRSGALFVILKNRNNLDSIVAESDTMGSSRRPEADRTLDESLEGKLFQLLPRSVAAELASLDGAIVLANSGELLAYGAVLRPKKKGRLRGTEGSRTKAALGASNYGLALKVSSDGDITLFGKGRKLFAV